MKYRLLISTSLSLLILLSCSGKAPDTPQPDPGTPPKPPITDIEVEKGKNLVGKIRYSDGKPAEGVVVTDGYSCTQTDDEGVYQLTRHREARHVIFSYPADCKVTVKKNRIPDFFREIDNTTASVIREDFTLERLENGPVKSFIFYPIGDPQIKTKTQMNRFVNEIIADMNENAASHGQSCFAMTLGDVCDWNPEMFGEIADIFDNFDIPCFHVIGNHDRDGRNADPSNYYISSLRTFEKYYTPVNYSFNYGDVHFVALDDIRDKQKGYDVDLTEEQIEWLRQDLSYVPKEKMVIVCLHGPVRTNRPSFTKRAALLGLLEPYKEAHIFSGHTHTNYTISHNDFNRIQEHVTGAACGMYWYGSICIDGTPIGYGKYWIDGPAISKGLYKSAGYDENVQARLYDQTRFSGWNNDAEKRKYVYCNVWNSTPAWKVELYEDGEFSTVMTRKSDYDYSVNDWLPQIWDDGYKPEPVTTGEMYHALPKSQTSKKSLKITDQYGQVFDINDITTNYNSYFAPAN